MTVESNFKCSSRPYKLAAESIATVTTASWSGFSTSISGSMRITGIISAGGIDTKPGKSQIGKDINVFAKYLLCE